MYTILRRPLSALLGLLLGVVILVSAAPTSPEVPSNVTINTLTYGGTGCPQGSASVLIAGKHLQLLVPPLN